MNMNDIIKNHRKFVANQIEKSFDGGINVSSNYIEKAKWKIGDEKQYQGVTWVVGGFNAKGTPLWRKKKDSGSPAGGSATPAQSTSEKSWDKQDSFNRRGTDENKLWNLWYHHQNTGDPFHVSAMVDILKKKFPNVAEFVQTAPNTGKSTITAKDSSGNEIATIDLSGNKTSIPTLQTFMDKCSAAVKAPAKKTKKQALKEYKDFIDSQVSKRGNKFDEQVSYVVFSYDKDPDKDDVKFDPENPYDADGANEVEYFDDLKAAKKYAKKLNSSSSYTGYDVVCEMHIQEVEKNGSWGDQEIEHAFSATSDGARNKIMKYLGFTDDNN